MLHPAPARSSRAIGKEGQPLLRLDGFARDPDALRTAARAGAFEPGRHHYPGIRAPLPPKYLRDQLPIIAEALGRDVELIDASFSIVTTPPGQLTVQQRLPHIDAFGADRVALIHYLSDTSDGTAFYRHRSTGFESVDEGRGLIYRDQLEAELRHNGPPPATYVAADTPLFERHTLAEAAYNRAYLYPGFLLHSGAIAPDATLSPDPAKGRLTVTAFLSVR
ncbi:MAG: DUF6445 family protein [Sphingomonas sp.]